MTLHLRYTTRMMNRKSLPLNTYTHLLQHPILRRLYALTWSTLITVALVQSSTQPVVGPAAPPGDPDPLRELLLNAAHLVAFSTLTTLWWWAFAPSVPLKRALTLALGIALTLSLVTELLQSLVPDREVSLLDMLMNALSATAAARAIWHHQSAE